MTPTLHADIIASSFFDWVLIAKIASNGARYCSACMRTANSGRREPRPRRRVLC